MSTPFEIVVSESVSTLLGSAVEAGEKAIELAKLAWEAEQELLKTKSELDSAQEDIEDCEPEEERELGRRLQQASQQVRHAERVHRQADDDAVFALDMFMEAFHQAEVGCRDEKPLNDELKSAESRFQHPHFESVESLDSMEVRLARMLEFLRELTKPEEVAFRNRLIAKAQNDRPEVRYFGRTNVEIYRVVGEL